MANSDFKNILEEIYLKSKNDNIPHVREQTIHMIIKLINDHDYKCVLEIGTAYGYSAAMIAINTNARITSIEKSLERYLIAKTFLNDFSQIELVNIDCHEFVTEQRFDVIFIDGPKAKQIQIFEQYAKFLLPNGVIIIDNIFMRKFSEKTTLTKNQQKLMLAVNTLREYLQNHSEFKCRIIDIDDGIAILERR